MTDILSEFGLTPDFLRQKLQEELDMLLRQKNSPECQANSGPVMKQALDDATAQVRQALAALEE